MTPDIIIVLAIIGVALILFIWERFSIDTVSILVMFAFVASGILTPEEGFSGFINPAVITIAAMFVISAAVFKSGALDRVGALLTRTGKRNYTLFLLTLMLMTGLMSAFINDTAVVALLMPVALKVARETGISPSRILMPLSFGALMGGACTLIGTSTNIMVSGIAQEAGLEPFSMFELTRGGVFFLVVGIVYMVIAGNWLLPKRTNPSQMIDEYDLGAYLTEISIPEHSTFIGKSINELPLFSANGLEPIQLIRGEQVFNYFDILPLRKGDILKIQCDLSELKKLRELDDIDMEPTKKFTDEDLTQGSSRLFEVVIPPNSPIVGSSLSKLNFRTVYDAVVLAIRSRSGEVLHQKLNRATLSAGDVLLLKAEYNKVKDLAHQNHIIIISEYEERRFSFRRILPVLLIAAAAIATAAAGLASISLTAPLAVLLLIMLRRITPEEAYQSIDWKVIFMIGGVLSMGLALEKTGASALMGDFIVNSLGQLGPRAVLSGFFAISFLMTNVMSNNATAALLAPIAIATAASLGVNPLPLLVAVTFAASLSFMTPMGYQTNTMIYTPGNYRFKDYLRVGTPLNLLFWILATFILPWLYPF